MTLEQGGSSLPEDHGQLSPGSPPGRRPCVCAHVWSVFGRGGRAAAFARVRGLTEICFAELRIRSAGTEVSCRAGTVRYYAVVCLWVGVAAAAVLLMP